MGARRFLKNIIKEALQESGQSTTQQGSAQPGRRMAVYLGNDTVLTQTKYGQKMYLLASDKSLTPHIVMDGYWEEWITNIFRSIIKPGMTVVDIGANVGYYTLLAASAVGNRGKVIAFEANPVLAEIVFRNLHINGFNDFTEVVTKAAFSETTELSFSVNKNYKGSSSIWGSNKEAAAYMDEVEIIKVPAVTLDDQLKGQKVDFIKIDAEGAEGHILLGAKETLQNNPHIQILIEYCPQLLASTFESIAIFHELLNGLGFDAYVAEPDSSLKKMTYAELEHSGISHCDMLLKRRT